MKLMNNVRSKEIKRDKKKLCVLGQFLNIFYLFYTMHSPFCCLKKIIGNIFVTSHIALYMTGMTSLE